MTREEWKVFSDELLIAFPGFRDYVNQKSSNPQATLETWYATLREVSYQDAKLVLNEWLSGTHEPPKAYERDYVAIVIRSRVGFLQNAARATENKYREAKSLYEEKQAAAERRKTYTPLPCMVEAFEIASKAYRQVLDGQIDEFEYKRICMEAIK